MRGENNPNFKQGFSINQWGYKMININGHKVYEHRYVMEQYLGRTSTVKRDATPLVLA